MSAAGSTSRRRILILDDMQERHDGFRLMFKGRAEVVSAYTVAEFASALNTGRFNLICLDHDLEMHPKADIDPNHNPYSSGSSYLTGRDAVEILTKRPMEEAPESILVHSWNTYGARLMEEALRDHFGDRVKIVRREFSPPRRP